MTVSQLIKILEQLNPDLDIYYVQNTGIMAPIKSVQEVSFRGFKPDPFVGLCCGNSIKRDDILASPVYISQKKQGV